MLLEDAIEQHRSAMALLNGFRKPSEEKGREDDIFVRPYIVRAHWRIRVFRKKRQLKALAP
jgi:hypothetical protein